MPRSYRWAGSRGLTPQGRRTEGQRSEGEGQDDRDVSPKGGPGAGLERQVMHPVDRIGHRQDIREGMKPCRHPLARDQQAQSSSWGRMIAGMN